MKKEDANRGRDEERKCEQPQYRRFHASSVLNRGCPTLARKKGWDKIHFAM